MDSTRRVSQPRPPGWRGKRALDLLAVIAAGPAALIILALVGLAIAIAYGRPVFFTQERIGQHGRRFKIFKLRTMMTASTKEVPTQVQDARITPLGKILREYRIDELPQLLNILLGDMSLIGPRPEQPRLVEQYRAAIPHFDERHLVKPGITGLAQVCYGYAGNLRETKVKVRYDRLYVRNCSPKLDVMIAARTVSTILRNEGAR